MIALVNLYIGENLALSPNLHPSLVLQATKPEVKAPSQNWDEKLHVSSKGNKYLNCSFTYPKLFEIDTTLESGDLANLLVHDAEHAQVWKVVHSHYSRKPKEEDL